jgi:hypothetical protein
MEQDEIDYKYDQMVNSGSHSSNWSFFISYILFTIIFVGGLILIPMILNDLWMFAIMGGLVVSVFVRSFSISGSRRKEFFQNPDVHTHTDACPTCRNLFGPGHSMAVLPPYVLRMASKCRHASGQMDYPHKPVFTM